jgi:O-antigen ligase
VLFAAVIWWRGPRWDGGFQERLTIWQWVTQTIPSWKWLVGFGPGSWSDLIPRWQIATFGTKYPVYVQAHNEVLQVLFETGLVGAVLIGAWLWSKRAMLQGSYAGSIVAMAVCSMLMFPFRLAVVGGTALFILGLATRKPCSIS